jgi:hypothetical protein
MRASEHSSFWKTIFPVRWLCAYRWQVGLRKRTQVSLAAGTLDDFILLKAPYGHFYADPFIVEEGQRVFLFMEDYSYLARTAKLICAELDGSGNVLETRTIVAPPYHISYPHVFACDGTYYIIPETAAADRVELYRATRFPWEWRLEKILLSGLKLHDPTHIIVNNEHWIFAGGSSTGAAGKYDQLHLFHAPSIFDNFKAHPNNPVKLDSASARPAGRIIMNGDRLIRPAQDCSRWYGCGLKFMAVDSITPSHYAEHAVAALPASWLPDGYIGTHTYNTSEHFEVVDVCSYGLAAPAVAGRARTLFGRITGLTAHKRQPKEVSLACIKPGQAVSENH